MQALAPGLDWYCPALHGAVQSGEVNPNGGATPYRPAAQGTQEVLAVLS